MNGLSISTALATFPADTPFLVRTLPTGSTAAEGPIVVSMKKMEIDGLNIAHREGVDPDSLTVLLLDCYPTSPQMFRDHLPPEVMVRRKREYVFRTKGAHPCQKVLDDDGAIITAEIQDSLPNTLD